MVQSEAEGYFAGAYWRTRKETLRSCVDRSYDFFQLLSQLNKGLTEWYKTAHSLDEALKGQVDINEKRELQRAFDINTIDDREEESGFRMALWTGKREGENVVIRIYCGGNIIHIPNHCTMRFPYDKESQRRILTFAQADRLLRILIKCWEPEDAIITSYELSEQTQYDDREKSEVGWFTYLKKSVERFPAFVPPVEVEPINEGEGVIIKIGREVLSADNPSHVEQVIRVRDQLNERGLLD